MVSHFSPVEDSTETTFFLKGTSVCRLIDLTLASFATATVADATTSAPIATLPMSTRMQWSRGCCPRLIVRVMVRSVLPRMHSGALGVGRDLDDGGSAVPCVKTTLQPCSV